MMSKRLKNDVNAAEHDVKTVENDFKTADNNVKTSLLHDVKTALKKKTGSGCFEQWKSLNGIYETALMGL